jgi:hypothetical protein
MRTEDRSDQKVHDLTVVLPYDAWVRVGAVGLFIIALL